MAFPDPQPGLVISYAYLWHREHRAGQEEGRKDRPCVIVVSVRRTPAEPATVQVVPVTHSRPDDGVSALEIPLSVKGHLGLDDAPNWVILDELNEFTWPGFDLRPVPHAADRFAYGFLPPRLFQNIVGTMSEVWQRGRGQKARRD